MQHKGVMKLVRRASRKSWVTCLTTWVAKPGPGMMDGLVWSLHWVRISAVMAMLEGLTTLSILGPAMGRTVLILFLGLVDMLQTLIVPGSEWFAVEWIRHYWTFHTQGIPSTRSQMRLCVRFLGVWQRYCLQITACRGSWMGMISGHLCWDFHWRCWFWMVSLLVFGKWTDQFTCEKHCGDALWGFTTKFWKLCFGCLGLQKFDLLHGQMLHKSTGCHL